MILDFFNSINLNITIDDSALYRYRHMFDHLKYNNEQPSNDDIRELLSMSYKYETNENISTTMLNNIMSTPNNIYQLYTIIEPKKPCKRNRMVYIMDAFGSVVHKAAKQSYIDINRLQQWVNGYHNWNFEDPVDKLLCGFILYLLYVRIHPHEDGNGRISRYLFLENRLMSCICPLSETLHNHLYITWDAMNEVFKWLDSTINSDTATSNDYYRLHIPSKIIRLIYYIIYTSIIYRYCIKASDKCKQYIDNMDYKYIICTGKTPINNITNEHKRNIKAIIRDINEVLDYKTHINILLELRSK